MNRDLFEDLLAFLVLLPLLLFLLITLDVVLLLAVGWLLGLGVATWSIF